MGNSLNWLWELTILVINFSMAYYQAKWFDSHKDGKTKFLHWTWAAFYINVVGWSYFIDYSIILPVELILVRMISFNFFLNRLRTPKKPWFYISNQKEGGSWVDRIETFLYGKFYPEIWGIYCLGFIYFNIKYK